MNNPESYIARVTVLAWSVAFATLLLLAGPACSASQPKELVGRWVWSEKADPVKRYKDRYSQITILLNKDGTGQFITDSSFQVGGRPLVTEAHAITAWKKSEKKLLLSVEGQELTPTIVFTGRVKDGHANPNGDQVVLLLHFNPDDEEWVPFYQKP